MVLQSYAECFWGGDLGSVHGYEALVKRNHEGKKMCQELEEYLKKRAKLEFEFSKSLNGLAKCFKFRKPIGGLEAAFNEYKQELDSKASSHYGTAVFFSNQAESVKTFRDDQNVTRKQVEENLQKAQTSKLSQLSKTINLEKAYMKKCSDRDIAENNYKEIERDNIQGKDVEKAKTRLFKAEEEAQKADSSYRSGVLVLDSATSTWEQAMESTCQIIQEMDEKRVHYLRQELWIMVNVDSKMSLDVDNFSEKVRYQLELCDVEEDIQSFIQSGGTGTIRPKHYQFKLYTAGIRNRDSDADSTSSSTDHNDDRDDFGENGGTLKTSSLQRRKKLTFSKLKNPF